MVPWLHWASEKNGIHITIKSRTFIQAIVAVLALACAPALHAQTSLIWRALVSNTWDKTTTNWVNAGTLTPTNYADGDAVIFDDSAGGSAVNVSAAFAPASVTFSNNTLNYAFSGSGSIGGTGALLMTSAGTVTMSVSNGYTGGTTINNGLFIMGTSNAIPVTGVAPDKGLGLNGELDMNGFNCIFTNGFHGAGIVTNSGPAGTTNTLTVGAAFTTNTFTGLIEDSANSAFISLAIWNYGGAIMNLGNQQIYHGITWAQKIELLLLTNNCLPTNGVVYLGYTNNNVEFIMNGYDQTIGGLVSVSTNGGTHYIASAPGANSYIPTLTLDVASGASYNYLYSLGGSAAGAANLDSFNLVKTGPGQQTIFAAYYLGTTVISGGTLVFDGNASTATNTITAQSGGILSGNGTLGGAVTVLSGGVLSPEDTSAAEGIGTLTISNTLMLAGTTVMKLSRDLGYPTNDEVAGLSAVSFGGALTVTNVSTNSVLQVGDTFQLFNVAGSGSFSSVTLPPLSPGLGWTNLLSVNGTIQVMSLPVPPPLPITNAVINPAIQGQVIANWGFDIKFDYTFAKSVTQSYAQMLFVTNGFTFMRIPIYAGSPTIGSPPASPGPGQIIGNYYTNCFYAMTNAQAARSNVLFFAELKDNGLGTNTFPPWVWGTSGVIIPQYAILLADYLNFMQTNAGIKINILGVDCEDIYNGANITASKFNDLIKDLRALSTTYPTNLDGSIGFPMPEELIGPDNYGPDTNFMTTLIANGWGGDLNIVGTHYYPQYRPLNNLQNLVQWGGTRPDWQTELHWNGTTATDFISQAESSISTFFQCTDTGLSGFLWWGYGYEPAVYGDQFSIEGDMEASTLNARPVYMTNDIDGAANTPGQLITRAFASSTNLAVWAVNNTGTIYTNFGFSLLSGAINGTVTYTQWTPAATKGLVGNNATVTSNTLCQLTLPSNSITLFMVPLNPLALLWQGQSNNIWNTTTTNWVNANTLAGALYQNNFGVLFNDSASNATVSVPATVSPGNVTFSNNALSYIFSGSGGITGDGGLFKAGSGSVTMGLSNSYSGGTVINNGVFKIGAAGAIPVNGDLDVEGMLDLNGFNIFVSGLSGGGTITDSGEAGTTNVLTVNSQSPFDGLIMDSGSNAFISLVVSNPPSGILFLSTNQNYHGITWVSSGQLMLGTANTLPTNSVVYIGTPSQGANVAMNGYDQTIGGLISAGSGGGVRYVGNGSSNFYIPTLTLNVAAGVSNYYAHSLGGNTPTTDNFNLLKIGPGRQTIFSCYYTGTTVIAQGQLVVDGVPTQSATAATNMVTVQSGGTLSGWGVLGGPVTVQSGGVLAPGDTNTAEGIGTLTISNTLTLQGTTTLKLSRDGGSPTNDEVAGLSSVNFGGSLVVTNVSTNGVLQSGDTFKLFNVVGSGSFSSVILPSLSSGLAWTNLLSINGTIQVVSLSVQSSPPMISNVTFSHNNLVLINVGATNTTCWLLRSTNMALSLMDWTVVATNVVGANGLSTNTLTINPAEPQEFYRLQMR